MDKCQRKGHTKVPCSLSRRTWLTGGAAAFAALAAATLGVRRSMRASVFIADNQTYDGSLTRSLREALTALGWDVTQWRGRRVLLKPNLVEPDRRAPHLTTHPALVAAAAAVFQSAGAHVVVGEGPGHVRDTDLALEESGLADVLREERLEFADLNYQETVWQPNRGKASRLRGFHLPTSVLEADLVITMPKLKTHHWMGMTASMKNLYGLLPGLHYGWPKNVLHHAGIPQTVFDLAASVPRTLAIVDAIECMEGDGPILGTPRQLGVILVGDNLAAVDATAARLMRLRPERIPYLRLAANRLGPISDRYIQQCGAAWQPLAQTFALPPAAHLATLRA